MTGSDKPSLRVEIETPSFLRKQLADFLTLSRGIIGLAILSLSFIGKDAYIAVVILALIGAATDIFDGKAARHYLGENRQGKLGRYDLEVDTLFVLCIIGYFSFSGIVIPKLVGLGWIGFTLIATTLHKRKPKILLLFEIPSILAIIVVAGLHNLEIFILIIVPTIAAGVIMNHRRVLYIIFRYWPKLFSK